MWYYDKKKWRNKTLSTELAVINKFGAPGEKLDFDIDKTADSRFFFMFLLYARTSQKTCVT